MSGAGRGGRRVHLFVSGRVQGVWFRQSTRRRAEQLALSGWVRNLPDGRVEALFEGEPSAVDQALAFVHEGPEHAHVERVDIESDTEVTPPTNASFEVR